MENFTLTAVSEVGRAVLCSEPTLAGAIKEAYRKFGRELIQGAFKEGAIEIQRPSTCPGRGDCAKCGNCAADAAAENWDGVGHSGDTSELEAAHRRMQGYPD